jgi:hypothetical protein
VDDKEEKIKKPENKGKEDSRTGSKGSSDPSLYINQHGTPHDGALISMRAYLSAADVFYPLPQTLLLRNYLSSFWALHMKRKGSAGLAVNSSISLAADGGSSWTETSKQVRDKPQNFKPRNATEGKYIVEYQLPIHFGTSAR